MPRIPDDAKDILNITEADIAKLMESPLFAVISGIIQAPEQSGGIVECTKCGRKVLSDQVDIIVEDGEIVVSCKMNVDGRCVNRINGRSVTRTGLKDIARLPSFFN